jgi:drug/metabolite transporter (DMT)-like permease
MDAVQIAFFRFFGSFLILLVVGRGRGLRPRQGNLGRLLFRGLIGGVSITLYFVGIEGAGAGLATLLQNAFPVFAALIACTLFEEVFTPRILLALAMSVCGAAVVLSSRVDLDEATTLGVSAAIAAAVLSGGAVVAAQRLRRSESASIITTYFMAVGALITAPALLAGLPAPSPSLLASLAGVVTFSVIAQWLLHHGLGFTSATQGSLAAATSVFTAAALEAMVLGEVPSGRALGGAVLMIAAVGLASMRSYPWPLAIADPDESPADADR